MSDRAAIVLSDLLISRLILFLESHLCLLLGFPLLLDLLLLHLVLEFSLLLLLSFGFLDLLLALVDPGLICVVQATLATGLNVDEEDVVFFLKQALRQVVAIDDLTPTVHYETLLDLGVVGHGASAYSVW